MISRGNKRSIDYERTMLVGNTLLIITNIFQSTIILENCYHKRLVNINDDFINNKIILSENDRID